MQLPVPCNCFETPNSPFLLCFSIPLLPFFSHPHFHVYDIHMITRPAVQYTSLRDIIPEHPPPQLIVSPVDNSSWNEIPIKNPLVKHAALAYLQATPTPPEVGNKGFFFMLKDKCSCRGRGLSGCFDCLNGVVFKAIAELFVGFCEMRGTDGRHEDDDDQDEENVD